MSSTRGDQNKTKYSHVKFFIAFVLYQLLLNFAQQPWTFYIENKFREISNNLQKNTQLNPWKPDEDSE